VENLHKLPARFFFNIINKIDTTGKIAKRLTVLFSQGRIIVLGGKAELLVLGFP
jgi:hypothetical protein